MSYDYIFFDLDGTLTDPAEGITNSVASCTLYIELGREVYMSIGSEKNLKITNCL